MGNSAPLGEWLKILLEEIDRKQHEAALAREEHERRSLPLESVVGEHGDSTE